MSLTQYSEALAHWAKWAARLRLAEPRQVLSSPKTQWTTCSLLVQTFAAFAEVEKKKLLELYEESKARLIPLSDPLNVSFSLHRQLSSSREEVYSDWFQWVLEQIGDPRLIARILGCSRTQQFGDSIERIRIAREERVEHGHPDRSGRLDVVVWQRAERLAVIEVKTRSYGEAELGKHEGYRKSVDSPGTEFIFLGVDEPQSNLGGFRFLAWADVCIALRRTAQHRLGPHHVLSTALILAFVGAVEQNLLRFVSPESLMPIGKIPRMVDHLTEAQQNDDPYEF